MKRFLILLIMGICTANAQSPDIYQILSPHLNIQAGYENNWWIPYVTPKLKYKTEGYNVGYFDINIRHGLKWIPDLRFNWQTNFNQSRQEEILEVHNQTSSLEQGYNRFTTVLNFSRKIDKYINPNTNKEAYGIPYQILEVHYTKETFLISVTPTVDNLTYSAYFTDHLYSFDKGMSISSFTKFQELSATIPISLLSGIENINSDIRIGLFFSTLNKPFEANQVKNPPDHMLIVPNQIYSSNIFLYGIVYEIRYQIEDLIYSISLKGGTAKMKLKDKLDFGDSNNQDISYGGVGFELPYRIRFTKNSGVQLSLSGQHSGLFGETITDSAVKKSTYNKDFLLKLLVNIYYNL